MTTRVTVAVNDAAFVLMERERKRAGVSRSAFVTQAILKALKRGDEAPEPEPVLEPVTPEPAPVPVLCPVAGCRRGFAPGVDLEAVPPHKTGDGSLWCDGATLTEERPKIFEEMGAAE